MKAVGVAEFAIEFSYICQALFFVIVGSLFATALVFLIIKPIISAHPIDTPFAKIVLSAEPVTIATKFMLVFVISILAGYLPARLIVKTNTLNAILGRNK